MEPGLDESSFPVWEWFSIHEEWNYELDNSGLGLSQDLENFLPPSNPQPASNSTLQQQQQEPPGFSYVMAQGSFVAQVEPSLTVSVTPDRVTFTPPPEPYPPSPTLMDKREPFPPPFSLPVACPVQPNPVLIERMEINNNGTVREDKTNSVNIYLDRQFFSIVAGCSVNFGGSQLGTKGFMDNIRMQIESGRLEPRSLYVFFSLTPNFGEFKQGITSDGVAKMQKLTLVDSHLELKILFSKSLRPSHSLEEKYQKKKNNFMKLQIVLACQQTHNEPFMIATTMEPFWFRSNSGKSNRVYTTKRKLATVSDIQEPVGNKRQKQEPPPLPAGNVLSSLLGNIATK